MAKITAGEWYKELMRLEREARNPEGYSTEELAERMNCCQSTVRTRLRAWLRQGLVRRSGSRQNTSLDGKRCHTPVYVVNKAALQAVLPEKKVKTPRERRRK